MNYRPDKVQLMSSSWLTRAYRQLCPFITPKDSLLKPHSLLLLTMKEISYLWHCPRICSKRDSDAPPAPPFKSQPFAHADLSHLFLQRCVCSARYELHDSCSHASLAWVLHCDALPCRADSTRTSLRCFMNPYTSTWGIFRYSMESARTWVFTH